MHIFSNFDKNSIRNLFSYTILLKVLQQLKLLARLSADAVRDIDGEMKLRSFQENIGVVTKLENEMGQNKTIWVKSQNKNKFENFIHGPAEI